MTLRYVKLPLLNLKRTRVGLPIKRWNDSGMIPVIETPEGGFSWNPCCKYMTLSPGSTSKTYVLGQENESENGSQTP